MNPEQPIDPLQPVTGGDHFPKSGSAPHFDVHLLDAYSNAVSSVAAKVSPALVRIEARRRRDGKIRGLASGFIINAEGYIITNARILDRNSSLLVTLADGRQPDAVLIGKDEDSDIAVLRVYAPNLVPAQLGTSANLRAGQLAVVLSSLQGAPCVVTAGIINAVGRTMQDDFGRSLPGMIQTDAAVDPLSPGGPLTNSRGEVVGVTSTAIIGFPGQSFAIAIDTALHIADLLIQHGRVKRLFLGVNAITAPLHPKIVQTLALPSTHGVRVVETEANGLAERAGLRAGDLVVAFRGQPISTLEELHRTLLGESFSDAALTVIRRFEKIEIPLDPVVE